MTIASQFSSALELARGGIANQLLYGRVDRLLETMFCTTAVYRRMLAAHENGRRLGSYDTGPTAMLTMQITLEPETELTPEQRAVLARAAHTARPNAKTRVRLAAALNHLDCQEDIIALLQPERDLSVPEVILLSSALLRRPGRARLAQAMAAIDQVYGLAREPIDRGLLLTQAGRIRAGLKDMDGAHRAWTDALELAPNNSEACMRRAVLDLKSGNPLAALALVEGLRSQGVRHAYILAVETLALARAGDIAAARRTSPLDLTDLSDLSPPDGWANIDDFNAELAKELIAHPAFARFRYGSAKTARWGIESPLSSSTPLLHLLMKKIASALVAPLERFARTDHPWSVGRPSKAVLHCSCVVANCGEFDEWHVHPTGWLNGVYYVQVPEGVSTGQDQAGCVAFGLPDSLAGPIASTEYQVSTVRPRQGAMLLFPSHFYHRTFPHQLAERRIVITFELRPVERR